MLVVVEGKDLLGRQQIAALRQLVTDLQLVEGDSGLISIFSARQPAAEGGLPEPVFPEDLPEGAAYDALVKRLKDNDLIRGKLLVRRRRADAGRHVARPRRDAAAASSPPSSPTSARRWPRISQAPACTPQLSGVPIMQLQIRQAVERDRIDYNAVGFALGCLVAILFFRRVSFLVIATAPPLLAIVMALGAIGWLGLKLNMFLNVMTPLIMVISFSDSMQLTFAARDRLIRGDDRVDRVPLGDPHRRPRLRADPRHRRLVVPGAALFRFRHDPRLRPRRRDLDDHRAGHGADRAAGARPADRPDRRAHGEPFAASTPASTPCARSATGSPTA